MLIYFITNPDHHMNQSQDIVGRLTGKGIYPHQFAWLLLLPFRNLYLSPRKLAFRLGLKEDSTVLEIGCGPGYFAPYIAKMIPKGKLFLTDIQKEMLDKARKRLQKKKVTNFEIQSCDGDSLNYPNASIDIIYMVTVLGEISNQKAYAKEMFRILKNGGIVSVSEQGGDPDSLSPDEIRNILEPEGFKVKIIYGKGRTFTANFIKESI